MCIRKDKRTPPPIFKEIRGIPLVLHYKYLRVIVDDCLKFDVELEAKKTLQEKLDKANYYKYLLK